MEYVGPIITAIRNAGPRIYGGAFVASCLLLFAPGNLRETIGLNEFVTTHRAYVGCVLVESASLLVVYVVAFCQDFIKEWLGELLSKRRAIALLKELTTEEKEFLKKYIDGDRNTVYAGIHDGIAGGLAAKGIIYLASQVSTAGYPAFPYNLQPWARKALRANPTFLQ
jgi:hypothetical protein